MFITFLALTSIFYGYFNPHCNLIPEKKGEQSVSDNLLKTILPYINDENSFLKNHISEE